MWDVLRAFRRPKMFIQRRRIGSFMLHCKWFKFNKNTHNERSNLWNECVTYFVMKMLNVLHVDDESTILLNYISFDEHENCTLTDFNRPKNQLMTHELKRTFSFWCEWQNEQSHRSQRLFVVIFDRNIILNTFMVRLNGYQLFGIIQNEKTRSIAKCKTMWVFQLKTKPKRKKNIKYSRMFWLSVRIILW